jgi:hypothetical protein
LNGVTLAMGAVKSDDFIALFRSAKAADDY